MTVCGDAKHLDKAVKRKLHAERHRFRSSERLSFHIHTVRPCYKFRNIIYRTRNYFGLPLHPQNTPFQAITTNTLPQGLVAAVIRCATNCLPDLRGAGKVSGLQQAALEIEPQHLTCPEASRRRTYPRVARIGLLSGSLPSSAGVMQDHAHKDYIKKLTPLSFRKKTRNRRMSLLRRASTFNYRAKS